jgi:hypothetical protein
MYTAAHPVLLLVFNRPDTTRQVFEAIARVQPARFYIAADGPRPDKAGEAELTAQVRHLVTLVDWPCEVMTLFQPRNLGCRLAIQAGLDWFFLHEEAGIILEDDCVPHADFFRFCDTLLDAYRDDRSVMMISGNQFAPGVCARRPEKVIATAFTFIWGWATWRRAWLNYTDQLPQDQLDAATWPHALTNRLAVSYLRQRMQAVSDGHINTWDYQWLFWVMQQQGLVLTPAVNLVENIGFGNEATHTTSGHNKLSDIQSLTLPQTPAYYKASSQENQQIFYAAYKTRLSLWLWWLKRLF